MIDRLIENQQDVTMLVRFLQRKAMPYRVKITDGRVRSIDQNHLLWLWLTEASMQREGMTVRAIRAEWKLRFGVPILAAANEDFAAMWLRLEAVFSYEELLERFVEHIAVTSLMTVTQMKTFLDEIYQYNAENGIELTSPEDIKFGTAKPARVDRGRQRNGNSPAGKAPRRKASTRAVR